MNLWRRVSRARQSPDKKSRRERGAALVEFALVAPLFFLVVFGGIELGLMARVSLTLNDASRTAVRTASIERDRVDADADILEDVNRRLGGLNGELVRVTIWNADTLSSDFDDLSMNCRTGTSQFDECTVYTAAQVDTIVANPDVFTNPALATTAMTLPAMAFDPSRRVDSTGGVINVGIHIEYEYQFVTGFFDTTTLTSTSIEVIETELDILDP